MNGLVHGLDVGPEVVDAVVIRYIAIFIWSVDSTKTIFDDEHWFLVAIPDGIEGDAQTQWVNLPAPLRCVQIWVFDGSKDIALSLLFDSWIASSDAA